MVELKDRQQQRWRASCDFTHTPDLDGKGSGSLLDSILSTVLKKK